MNRIDSLLRRAQQLSPNPFPCVSMLTQEGDKFRLSCQLWDGKAPGRNMKIMDTEHDTIEAARAEYAGFLEKYPHVRKWNPVLLDTVIVDVVTPDTAIKWAEGGGDIGKTTPEVVYSEGSAAGGDENGK